MKKRHAYIADSLHTAERCIGEARRMGLSREDISVVAKRDADLDPIPQELHDDSPKDTVPAAVRGLLGGGATGLLLGLVAASIPPLGVTLAGAALMGVAGASVGTWSAALMGSAIPNEVRRDLEESIDAGRMVIVLDIEESDLAQVDARMRSMGARSTDYESTSAIS